MDVTRATYANLATELRIEDGSIVNKTIYNDEFVKVVLFGFAAGQELSKHTAMVPAILHFLEGEAVVTLGDTLFEASASSFLHLPAKLPHSVKAVSPTKMLLTLLKSAK